MNRFDNIKVVAFDADDTLWACQPQFEEATDECCRLLEPWADAVTVRRSLFETEKRNMAILGYGTKAFTLSLIENAVSVSHGEVTGDIVKALIDEGKRLLQMDGKPLPEVEETLQRLFADGRYRLAVFTKGELLDQENKLARSGLKKYFSHVEIVSDKTRAAFLTLCRNMRTSPNSLLMVGNSMRSDIAPALDIGAAAVYVPFHITWELEQAEPVEHERMVEIKSFGELLKYI